MTTLTPQMPGLTAPATPTQTQATATDKFAAQAGCSYLVHYENGATPTTQCYVVNQNTTVPTGAATPSVPTGATNWSDVLVSAAIGANAERDIVIDRNNIQYFMDSTGFVNLKHNTPTTLTVAVYGPF